MRLTPCLCLFTSLFASVSVAEDDPYRFTLIIALKNERLEAFQVSDKTLTAVKAAAPWSVTKETLHGGKQEGVDKITIDNGRLQIVVIPTRGLSVLEVRHGDLRLGWDSPVKEVVHPQYVNLERRGGLGWLDGFNEWMVRCGLEFAGHPGLDQFVDNTVAKQQMNLTLHGKIGNIPASEVELLVGRRPPHAIRLRGTVHERSFYGPKLELATELVTLPGADTFTIVDQVANHSATDQEFQLIYHTNYGRPLLEQGSRVVVAAQRVTPMNDHAAPATSSYVEYVGPTKGFVEQVYLVQPLADAAGRTQVMLRNAAGDRGSSIAWNVRELPYLTIWKNTAAVEDGYVTGLEPATGFPFNRRVERATGRLAKLAPGERRQFTLDFALHLGTDAVAKSESAINELSSGRQPVLDALAPTVPE